MAWLFASVFLALIVLVPGWPKKLGIVLVTLLIGILMNA